jgi:hypothetical protein
VGLKRRGDEAAEANKRRPLDTKKRNVRCLPIEARPRSFHTEERRRNSRHEHHGSDRTEGPRRPRLRRGEDQHECGPDPKRGSSV